MPSLSAGKTPRMVCPSSMGVMPLSIQIEKLEPRAVSFPSGPTGTLPVNVALPAAPLMPKEYSFRGLLESRWRDGQ